MKRKQVPSHCGRTLGRMERVITVLVEASMREDADPPPNLIERLRCLEQSARASGGDRQLLQVLQSARRLLGDAAGPLAKRPVSPLDLFEPSRDSLPN